MKSFIFGIFLSFSNTLGWAQQTPGHRPMDFGTWKENQITQAQNQVVRISNQIQVLKMKQETTDPSQKTRAHLERQRKESQQKLRFAKALSMEDYLSVYLRPRSENESFLHELVKTMPQGEVAYLIKILLRIKKEDLQGGNTSRTRPTLRVVLPGESQSPRL